MRILVCITLALFLSGQACSRPENYEEQRRVMVERQILWRGITDQSILDALLAVPREEFVMPQFKNQAYDDLEVPIGEDQTLDRPYEDAFMIQALKIGPSDKVLEVGTGGGYLAALLSRIAREVYTIEILPEIANAAKARLEKLGYKNIEVRIGDGFLGWPEKAPFNAIVMTCSPPEIPKPLIEQLADGGRMVLPLGGEEKFQELLLYVKKKGKLTGPTRLAAFTFVPMKGKILESK